MRSMAKSYEEMLDEAREETEQTDPDAVHDALESGEDISPYSTCGNRKSGRRGT